jgi:hypothetical protein
MSGAPPRGAADLRAFCWLTMFWKAAWLLAAIRRWVFSSPAEMDEIGHSMVNVIKKSFFRG